MTGIDLVSGSAFNRRVRAIFEDRDGALWIGSSDGGLLTGGQTVLVVEDDPSTRDMFERTLRKNGQAVALANNGRIGIERVRERKPSLILLD